MSMMPDDNFLWSRLDIQDEISLVQQLYDVYREGTESGTLVLINDPETEKYVRLSPDVCGVRNEKTFERFELNKVLFPISQKTYPYFDKAVGTNIYEASIDWKALKYYAGRLHDHEADQPYGQFKQNKYLKDALIKEAKERGGNEMVVTERILGKYLDHVSTAQKIRGENSPDHFIRFVETLRSLEKDGFLRIVETEFDFDAFPIPAEEEMDKLEEGVSVDEDAYFYPAEHCQVTLRLMQLTSTSETLKRWGGTPLNKARNDLSQISDAGLERCFEDEIELINKLLQVCSPTTKSIQLIHPAHIANSSPDWAGFDKIVTLKDLDESYGVLSNFDPSLDVSAKNPVGFVKANIDYQKLLQRAENLHDEVESWQGKVYGIEEQKRRIWEKLQGRFRKNPQDEYEYSEWLLGPYTPRTESAPLGTSLSNPDPNRTDIRYQFMRAMRELEKDGRFEIIHVKIDFSAEPEPTETSLNAHKWSLGERSLEFIPAKHCKVTIRPIQQKQEAETKTVIKSPSGKKPYGKKPKCETKGGIGSIKLGSKQSKPFKKLNGRQWKLAKQLVEFFGLAKTDETIYENIKIPSDSTRYPEIFNDSYRRASRIYSIIENTIAEIQRNFAQSDLAGLFSIHHDGKKVWMDFLQ